MTDLVAAWGRSTTGELCWLTPSGPVGIPVIPLVYGDALCVALPMSAWDTAATLVGVRAAYSVTDTVHGGRQQFIATGPTDVRVDIDGDAFVDHLLEQEIVKYPPTRLRSDTLMDRREHWWWLPRIIVTLRHIEASTPVQGRSTAADALLVRRHEQQPDVAVVSSLNWLAGADDHVTVVRPDGSSVDGRGDHVFAFGHARSPDAERWERWHRRGVLTGDALVVNDAEGVPSTELSPFGLVERYRRFRGDARACRAGIVAATRQA